MTAEPEQQQFLGPRREQDIATLAAAVAASAGNGLGTVILVHGQDMALFNAAARALAAALERLLLIYEGPDQGGKDTASSAASRERSSSAMAPPLPLDTQEPMLIAITQQVASDAAIACLRTWPLQGQVVLRHVEGDGDPEEQALAAVAVDWGLVDGEQARYLWNLWGGEGPAPSAPCLASLQAAVQRQRLGPLARINPAAVLP